MRHVHPACCKHVVQRKHGVLCDGHVVAGFEHNGFSNKNIKDKYSLYEMGQTFAVQSFTTLNREELNHLDDIASLFVNGNQGSETVLLRTTPFFGGKDSHAV